MKRIITQTLLTGILITLVACVGQPDKSIPSATTRLPTTVSATTTPTTMQSIAPTRTLTAAIVSSLTSAPSPTVAATVPSSPSPSPTASPAPTASSTPSIERWRGLPLGPPGAVLAAEEEQFVVLESTVSLDVVEAFYRNQMAEPEWVLFECLRAPQTRFDGEAVFLLFWQPGQSACVLATTAADIATADTLTVITVSMDCATTRMTAENLRTAPWAAPEGIAWRQWETDTFTLRYPSDWAEDERLFEQPYCQPGTGIHCLAGFVYREKKGEGHFSLVARPRRSSKSLEELAIEAWKEGARATPGLVLVAAEPIRLDDGTQAVQVLSLSQAAGEPAIFLAVDVATEQDLYMLTGIMTGDSARIFELSEVIGAIARSFHLTGE